MISVFADTGYWIALVSRRDQLHAKTRSLSAKIGNFAVVTSEMVLAEFLNGVSNDKQLRVTCSVLVEHIRSSDTVSVIPQTARQFQAALERYKRSIDKEWSLTDCASFLIMEEHGIRAALTHDLHFVQAGFDALLR
jgi:predicted nucleic acid-binding protein